MRREATFLLLASSLLGAQDLGKLPDWARPHVEASLREPAPAGADAWVLLDSTDFAYTGGGEIRAYRRRLVRVLQEHGTSAAVFVIHGLGGKASRVKRLKGWNLRPDGELVRLDKDEIITLDSDQGDEVSTGLLTGAVLDRAVKGSLIAFESQEVVKHPLGPIASGLMMEAFPVRRWELQLGTREGWFTSLKAVETRILTRHFEPWLKQVEIQPDQSIRVSNMPALPKREGAAPPWRNALPQFLVQFKDPALSDAPPLQSWEALAQWFHGVYAARTAPAWPEGLAAPTGKAGLEALAAWMDRELRYRQVYLSPERGWFPEDAREIHRRRLGDCKDLSSCLIAGARKLGYEAFPALARIVDGEIEDGESPSPFAFNHVISAIRLPASLGFPAEVETPKGRFLLVDPTSRTTPLGHLPPAHAGRKVLICVPDGGAWAGIPEAAVERPRTGLDLEGSVAPDGRLAGSLTLLEEADHLGLRSALLQGGAQALLSSLQSLLAIPPAGSLKLEESGDPLALGVPFKVRVSIQHPDWFRHVGAEWVLEPYGVPGPADLIQKSGEARQYPVWLLAASRWTFHAKLAVPTTLVPLRTASALETPLRKVQGEASSKPGQIELRLELERRPARFGFEAREEGVKQQKRDRNQWKLFLEEFGAFKPAAP